MNNIQTEKVRRIIRKVQALPEKHEVGGWVEKDRIYIVVKPRSIDMLPTRHVSMQSMSMAASSFTAIMRPCNCETRT